MTVRILGVDPSQTCTGLSVVEIDAFGFATRPRLVCWQTVEYAAKRESFALFLYRVFEAARTLVENRAVSAVGIEHIQSNRGHTARIAGEIRGAVKCGVIVGSGHPKILVVELGNEWPGVLGVKTPQQRRGKDVEKIDVSAERKKLHVAEFHRWFQMEPGTVESVDVIESALVAVVVGLKGVEGP